MHFWFVLFSGSSAEDGKEVGQRVPAFQRPVSLGKGASVWGKKEQRGHDVSG